MRVFVESVGDIPPIPSCLECDRIICFKCQPMPLCEEVRKTNPLTHLYMIEFIYVITTEKNIRSGGN
jgi:hypothetical protein